MGIRSRTARPMEPTEAAMSAAIEGRRFPAVAFDYCRSILLIWLRTGARKRKLASSSPEAMTHMSVNLHRA